VLLFGRSFLSVWRNRLHPAVYITYTQKKPSNPAAAAALTNQPFPFVYNPINLFSLSLSLSNQLVSFFFLPHNNSQTKTQQQ
jgi:hypothetical protein